MSYDYSIVVEAENEDEARELADDQISSVGYEEWSNGDIECWAVDKED